MLKKAIIQISVLVFTTSFLSAQQATLYEQGFAEYKERHYLAAITLFEDHIKQNPSDNKVDDAKLFIGRALVYLDRLNEAEPFFREVSDQPGNRQDDASYSLAKLLYETGRTDESLKLFLIILQDFPDSVRADDAYWYVGEIQMDLGMTDEAEAAFRAVIENTKSNRRDEALYSLGYLQYTANRNNEALETFRTLLNEYPDDSKADDAMWRMGRIFMRLDKDDLAKVEFLKIMDLPDSNRYDEAFYDLGRIQYFTYRNYAGVVERFSHLFGTEQIGLYQKKSIMLGANAFYSLGLQARRDYEDEEATENFNSSILWSEYLLEQEVDDAKRADILFLIGKAHDNLFDLSSDSDIAKGHADSARTALISANELLRDSTGGEDILERLSDVQRTDSPYLTYDLSALGGYETIVSRPGARVSADLSTFFPVSFRQRLSAALSFDHEDLSIKTFNFDPGENAVERLVSRNEKLALDLGWRSGSIRSFRNDLNLKASYRWAEDPGDNRFLAAIDDTLLWRIDSNWKLDTFIGTALRIYPDYLVGTNKIDSITPKIRPEITYYGVKWMVISLAYEFSLKQYLQATYDGSNKNKQYITNLAEIELRRPSGMFRPSLRYEVAWLESNNYDVIVSGSLVTDYWDNITQSFGLGMDFRWTPKFRTEILGTFGYRAFSNYPARDATNTITGELRKDYSVDISLDMSYIFWEKMHTAISGVMEASWVQEVSNMNYDNSIATNYSSFGAYIGVKVKRR